MPAVAAARVAAVALCALLSTTTAGHADEFESAIRLGLALSDTSVVNWPPLGHAAIGAVLLPDGTLLDQVNVDTVPKRETVRLQVDVPAERLSPPQAFWRWRSIIAEKEQLDFKLRIDGLVVERLDGNTVSARGRVITTTWRANLVLDVKPKPSMASANWSALVDAIVADPPAGVDIGPSGLKINLGDQVVATDSMAPPQEGHPEGGRAVGPKRWAMATIASGRYAQLADMEQRWNPESADVARAALADWKPTVDRKLAPMGPNGIRRNEVLDFVDGFLKGAKAAKAELLVVYYVGHMERMRTGGLSLLMGDAPLNRDMRPPAPTGVSNLRDLAQVIDQIGAELAPDAGTLDVAVLHRRIGRAKIPFVLLVDGCLEDRTYAAARDRLGIVVDARGGEPQYVGPGEASVALRGMLQQLSSYPQDFPWLRSRDPTVLGATPGTLAYSEPHPAWLYGAPVGPVASRLAGAVGRTRYDKSRPNLIRILNFSADRQSIGPQELVGTVSWSDWLPYLRRFDPRSFKG